jgi:hypothetical protein
MRPIGVACLHLAINSTKKLEIADIKKLWEFLMPSHPYTRDFD